jgi:shikimate kinase
MKLFLIGMMGSGKSYWCKKLAKKLKCGAYDLDFLIESFEDKTIAWIFEEYGEDYFRKSEAEILRWFIEKKSYVVATGGGTPCFHENMLWMNQQGVTVWIDEPVEVLVKRLTPEKKHRPLIKDLTDEELKAFLSKTLEERRPFYGLADYHLRDSDICDQRFEQIIKKYEIETPEEL